MQGFTCSWIRKLTQLIYQIEGTRKELACVAGGIVVPGKLSWWRSERRRREGFLIAGGIVARGTFLAAELPRETSGDAARDFASWWDCCPGYFLGGGAATGNEWRRREEIYTPNLHFTLLAKKKHSPANPVLAGKELLIIIQSGNFNINYSKAWPIVVCCLVWSNLPVYFS